MRPMSVLQEKHMLKWIFWISKRLEKMLWKVIKEITKQKSRIKVEMFHQASPPLAVLFVIITVFEVTKSSHVEISKAENLEFRRQKVKEFGQIYDPQFLKIQCKCSHNFSKISSITMKVLWKWSLRDSVEKCWATVFREEKVKKRRSDLEKDSMIKLLLSANFLSEKLNEKQRKL